MRERAGRGRWAFTLDLLRAANLLSSAGSAAVRQVAADQGSRVSYEFRFEVPGGPLDALEVTGLVGAALEPDGGPHDLRMPVQRARARLGAAINLALGSSPVRVDVVLPTAARSFVRLESVTPDMDPYRVTPIDERSDPETFVVRLVVEQRWGARVAGWLGATDPVVDIQRVWHRALPGSNDTQSVSAGISTAWKLPGRWVQLGECGAWGRASGAGGPWLVRDGVSIASLARAMGEAGLSPTDVEGWIECPALRLTADGEDVVRDTVFDTLVAWLHDARAHTFDGTKVVWPDQLAHVATVSGRPIGLDQLQRRSADGRDLPFVWPHQAHTVPRAMQARVVRLWPSEQALLRVALPGISLVHLGVLGESPQLVPVDLERLVSRSFPAVELPDADAPGPDGTRLRLRLQAHVHRGIGAPAGSIVLLAYERRVAHLRSDSWVLPGVTLVCRMEGATRPSIDALRGDRELLAGVARACRSALDAGRERLLQTGFSGSNPWEVALVRETAQSVTAIELRLRYGVGESGQLRLVWRPSALLELPVGRDAGGKAVRLRDALERCRDVGGIVLGDETSRWHTLESATGPLAPWFPTPEGDTLLRRVLGDAVRWTMPTVPEARLGVPPVIDRRGALLDKAEVFDALTRSVTDPDARIALKGHLLAALALGEPTHGLETVALFTRYDPRAIEPARLVSLVRLERDRAQLAYPGVVGRRLARVAVEVTPGEAQVLFESCRLEPSPGLRSPGRDGGGGEERDAGPERVPHRATSPTTRPLATCRVLDPMAAGTLELAPDRDGGGVALWARGIHVGTIHLEGRWAAVTGRLWLTHRGIRRGDAGIRADLQRWAAQLGQEAARARLLTPPGTERRRALDEFASEGGVGGRTDGGSRRLVVDRLRDDPPPPLPSRRGLWIQALVRPALPVNVAFDRARLSWQVVRIEGPPSAPTLALGARHRWIQRAIAEEGSAEDAFVAAALVLAETLRQAREIPAPWFHEGLLVQGLYRIVAIAYAHGGRG